MSNNIPTPEVYEGPSGGLKKETIWLASEDIGLNKEVKVKIQDVERYKNVTFDAGRVEPKVAALRFEKTEKRMVLNATNRKTLVKMFGMDTKEWRGKEIVLWVDPNVKMKGEKVGGIRIKLQG